MLSQRLDGLSEQRTFPNTMSGNMFYIWGEYEIYCKIFHETKSRGKRGSRVVISTLAQKLWRVKLVRRSCRMLQPLGSSNKTSDIAEYALHIFVGIILFLFASVP